MHPGHRVRLPHITDGGVLIDALLKVFEDGWIDHARWIRHVELFMENESCIVNVGDVFRSASVKYTQINAQHQMVSHQKCNFLGTAQLLHSHNEIRATSE